MMIKALLVISLSLLTIESQRLYKLREAAYRAILFIE